MSDNINLGSVSCQFIHRRIIINLSLIWRRNTAQSALNTGASSINYVMLPNFEINFNTGNVCANKIVCFIISSGGTEGTFYWICAWFVRTDFKPENTAKIPGKCQLFPSWYSLQSLYILQIEIKDSRLIVNTWAGSLTPDSWEQRDLHAFRMQWFSQQIPCALPF